MSTIPAGSKVRIVSDGVGHSTRVEVDGKLLTNVTAVSWRADDPRALATATLELVDVELDVTLDGPQVTTTEAGS